MIEEYCYEDDHNRAVSIRNMYGPILAVMMHSDGCDHAPELQYRLACIMLLEFATAMQKFGLLWSTYVDEIDPTVSGLIELYLDTLANVPGDGYMPVDYLAILKEIRTALVQRQLISRRAMLYSPTIECAKYMRCVFVL